MPSSADPHGGCPTSRNCPARAPTAAPIARPTVVIAHCHRSRRRHRAGDPRERWRRRRAQRVAVPLRTLQEAQLSPGDGEGDEGHRDRDQPEQARQVERPADQRGHSQCEGAWSAHRRAAPTPFRRARRTVPRPRAARSRPVSRPSRCSPAAGGPPSPRRHRTARARAGGTRSSICSMAMIWEVTRPTPTMAVPWTDSPRTGAPDAGVPRARSSVIGPSSPMAVAPSTTGRTRAGPARVAPGRSGSRPGRRGTPVLGGSPGARVTHVAGMLGHDAAWG